MPAERASHRLPESGSRAPAAIWEDPARLNGIALALLSAAALLVLAAVGARALHHPAFALREVRITGSVTHVTREDLETVAQRDLRGSFFTVDIGATRAAFERLPWVRGAKVRRQWPAALEIALEEHIPLARWAGAALVNTHGEVFDAAFDGPLPVFAGPEDAAREMAIQYRYFRRGLAAIGETPVEVRVTPRRAWQVRLESGLTLALGRENVEARLARFVAVHEHASARLGRGIDYVDLRYANGYAVRVPGLDRGKPAARRGRAG